MDELEWWALGCAWLALAGFLAIVGGLALAAFGWAAGWW